MALTFFRGWLWLDPSSKQKAVWYPQTAFLFFKGLLRVSR